MGKILITDLIVHGIIGINDWERKQNQEIVINIELQTDLQIAGKSDKINDTINYRTLTKEVIDYTKKSEHFLVEALAEGIADICLQYGANSTKVKVEKPGALRFAKSVGVEIVRPKI